MKKSSPWGTIDHVQKLASGMFQVSTAGHGGIKLSRSRNSEMPEGARRKGGWYEEDCEWALVVLQFPEEFEVEIRESAARTAKEYDPEGYTAITGKEVALEESWSLRQRDFAERSKDLLVVTSACGAGSAGFPVVIPEGKVGVYARRGGDRAGPARCFLVEESRYKTRSEFGHVIQPDDMAV